MDTQGQEITVVILCKSRFAGKTVQEKEVLNSLTGQGPEMTQALLQEFFDSGKFDVCTVITEGNDCVQFTRDGNNLKVVLYLGGPPAYESEERTS